MLPVVKHRCGKDLLASKADLAGWRKTSQACAGNVDFLFLWNRARIRHFLCGPLVGELELNKAPRHLPTNVGCVGDRFGPVVRVVGGLTTSS